MRLPHLSGGIAALAILIAAALAGATQAQAQSADLVLCDRLAADAADPDKPTDVKGVTEVAASDIPTAIKYCKTAGNSSRRALYELGRAYAANRQLPEAMAAWRKAADKGSTSAMVELGVLYGSGAGVPKDEEQARKLFERAAQAGNPRGIANLAALSGNGAAPADPARAREMLAKAAETNAAAQYQLGLKPPKRRWSGCAAPGDQGRSAAARILFLTARRPRKNSSRCAGADGVSSRLIRARRSSEAIP